MEDLDQELDRVFELSISAWEKQQYRWMLRGLHQPKMDEFERRRGRENSKKAAARAAAQRAELLERINRL